MRNILKINENEEFFAGTFLRKYNIGLHVEESKNYHDYILVYAYWENDKMMLVNISKEKFNQNKTGLVYGGILQNGPFVKKSHFLFTLDDLENWYILD
jgi:hypothetical protein